MKKSGVAGEEESLAAWMGAAGAHFPTLTANIRADVCVLGAGLSGMAAAYALMREGGSVVVLAEGSDRDGPAGTPEPLSSPLDERPSSLERLHGPEGARLAAESRAQAADWLESVVERERISCGFERVDGHPSAPRGASPRWLEKDLAAASRAGMAGVQWSAHHPFFSPAPVLRFPDQLQFQPMRLLAGLATALRRGGVRIFGGMGRTARLQEGKTVKVRTGGGGTVECRAAIAAAQNPAYTPSELRVRHAFRQECLIAGRVPRGAAPRAVYWTGARVRLQALDKESDLLIAEGPVRGPGLTGCGALEKRSRELVPALGFIDVRTQVRRLEPLDGLPFVGRMPGGPAGVFVATGDLCGAGVQGAVAGILLADLIAGRRSPWAAIYDPARAARKAPKPKKYPIIGDHDRPIPGLPAPMPLARPGRSALPGLSR